MSTAWEELLLRSRGILSNVLCEWAEKDLFVDPSVKGFLDLIAGSSAFFHSHNVDRVHIIREKSLPQAEFRSGNVVFIVRSTISVLRAIASRISKQQYSVKNVRIYILPAVNSACMLELEKSGVIMDRIQCRSLPLYLVPCDVNILTLGYGTCFYDAYIMNDTSFISYTAKSIIQLEEEYGSISLSTIETFGEHAERVKKLLLAGRKLPHTVQKHPVRGSTIDRLLLLDRMEDAMTPLLTPLTYEGLLDDVFGIDQNVVEFLHGGSNSAVRKLMLRSDDEVLQTIRDKPITVVLEQLLPSIARALSDTAQQKFSTDERTSVSMEDIHRKFADLPDVLRAKKSCEMHIELAHQLARATEAQDLMHRVSIEKLLLEHGKNTDIQSYMEELLLRTPPADIHTVLRLLCIQSLVRSGLKSKLYRWYIQQLCHSYGHGILPLLDRLSELKLFVERGEIEEKNLYKTKKKIPFFQQPIIDDGQRLETGGPSPPASTSTFTSSNNSSVPGSRSSMSQVDAELKSILPSEKYIPRSIQLIQSALKKTTAGSQTGKKHVCVFFIGGLSYAEIAYLRIMYPPSHRTVKLTMATTSITNGTRNLQELTR